MFEVTIDRTSINQDKILVIEQFNPSFDVKNSLIIELKKLSKIKRSDIESLLCTHEGDNDILNQ